MTLEDVEKLELTRLCQEIHYLTPEFGSCLMQAGAICLEDQGHFVGVNLTINGEFNRIFALYWPAVTDQMRRTWQDEEVATEHGAYGIAFLLILDLTGLTVIERSIKGTGFDYWIGDDSGELFQNKARLEVSGIRRGDDSSIKARVKKKIKQTQISDGFNSAYIVVVEFSRPISQIVKR
ncbi:hypothetical protein [Desulfobacca acetoxidans]|uniref:Uncharacterized protein n=1 Tax=Desulfobacca acetoxidans (strain ATCC 700848 / DSM 11109 / ASRB2) TaxID=880072 RepID=F2NG94_DESAR|nr:hypothetical protein [Desulfobacca acetoxidans]AEB08507.1 hypothetical protein Desac_0622 [Desulfobacca acetoxidans DSM 11109]